MSAPVLTLVLALTASTAALAQDADPPTRVARLSLIEGAVSFQASGAGAPEEAELNRPLTWGDRLLTDRGSRTEMSVGTAAIRLDEHTDLTIANLDEDIVQLELNSGTVGIHLRELGEAETFEIDTPNATVLLREPGDYRIGVDAESATLIAVLNGEAELDGGAGPIRLGEQQELRFTGDEQVADMQALGPLGEFDEWCIERERTLAARETSRYVSREVVGYEDLDSHGRWWNEPGYGYVWAPTYILSGWAPYRYGHWTWIGPWGFTWVDHAPWGYAPFHYGRWAYLRHRWCWVPGPRHFRPVWAPALVGWHGMPGVRDPSRAGSVRYFPLGPRDVYVPVHPASARYVRAVNISNTTIDNNTQITNAWRGRLREPRFANRDAPDAATSLPAAAFSADRGAGRVMRVRPTPAAGNMSHLATSQPGRDERWRDAFNARPNPSSASADATKVRRQAKPAKRIHEERGAMRGESRERSRGPRDSRALTRNASSGSSRGDRGGASGGGRVERSGNAGGQSRMSGARSQSGSGGAARSGSGGGGARTSGSRGQSGRGAMSPVP